MSGLLLIALALIWIAIAAVVAWMLARRRRRKWSVTIGLIFALTLLVTLPFIDEIVGRHQLQALCRDGVTPRYETAKLRGRSVHMRQVPYPGLPQLSSAPFRAVSAWIPIEETTVEWLDDQTNEVLLSYKRYVAKGGWLIRALKLSETDAPLTFDPHSCSFNEVPLFRELGVTYR